MGLSASGPGIVVVVAELEPSEGGAVVAGEEPGVVVVGWELALTAKFEPVTTTTSAPCEAGRADPTSMVSVVAFPVVAFVPFEVAPPSTSPGS